MKPTRNITRIGIIALALALIIAMPVTAATLANKTIDVKTGAEIYINGDPFIPTDVNGNPVEVFIYNGTTYLPARAISNVFETHIEWDGANSRVYIGESPTYTPGLMDICPPYQTDDWGTPESVMMGGNEYFNVITSTDIYGADAYFNLNAEYTALSFDFGHIDGKSMWDGTVQIYLDGELAFEHKIDAEALPQHFEVPLNNALQMKIVLDGNMTVCAMANVEIR